MTKPTAASVNRNAEKAEAKSPPRSSKLAAPAAKPKINGAKTASKSATSAPSTSTAPAQEADDHHEEPAAEDPVEATPVLATTPAAIAAATPEVEEDPIYAEAVEADAPKGNMTPNDEQAEPDLEATPAAIGGEENIR
jgi:hypothetical protein